jgi:hypothetical protein
VSRKPAGVKVVLRCPDCGMEYVVKVVPVGVDVKPGQVLDQPHLLGMCPEESQR